MRKLVLLALVLVAGVACGDDGAGGDVAGPSTPTGVTATEDPTGATGGTDASEPAGSAPDACSLVTAGQIAEITGLDPGAGAPSGGGERTICIYGSGLITAVEVAENYEASKAIIESEREIEPVTGVGVEAFWDPAGQLVALGDEFFVGVTLSGDDAQAQAAEIAAIMLGNL
jgi:hypothetical protein